MKKLIKVLGIGAITLGLLGSGVAMARGGGPMGGHAIKEVLRALDLDAEQKALVEDMKSSKEADREANKAFKESSQETFLNEFSKETPNSRTMHNLLDDGFERAADVAHSGLDDLLELHATFTPEQRETFVSELESAQARHEEMREKHQEDRKGGRKGPPSDRDF